MKPVDRQRPVLVDRPHIWYRGGFWRMRRPDGDFHAAPTLGALTAYVQHPWTEGWVA